MYLITKNNCPACDKVKRFLDESDGYVPTILNVDTHKEWGILKETVKDFGGTYPLLIDDPFYENFKVTFWLNNSDDILGFIRMSDDLWNKAYKPKYPKETPVSSSDAQSQALLNVLTS